MSKKVIELIRVSTEGQAAEDRAGIPAQKAANRLTAKRYDLEIVKTIQMSDVSGAAVLHAPEMQEMLRLIESPQIHGVVAREFSRLMRPENYADYALLQAFVDTSTVLYLPDGPIDFASKMGRLLGTMRAALAGLERTEILERIWSAKEEKRRAGKHPQSDIVLPFGVGYNRKENRWYYKPEAEKVREAFRRALGGEVTYWALGLELGIASFNLRNILRNPIYTGWRVYTQKRDLSPAARRVKADGRQGDRPKIRRTPEEIIRVKVMDPLVSEADFLQVQKILDLKKQNHWRVRPGYEPRFVYHGFLRCGDCRNLVYTHTGHSRDWYLCKSRTTAERIKRERAGLPKCSNPYMRRQRLEDRVDTLLSRRLTDIDFLARITQALIARTSSREDGSKILRAQNQLKRQDVKRQRVHEAYFEGLIGREERDRRIREVENDTKLYQDILLRAQPASAQFTPGELAEVFSPFHEWEFLSQAQKRRLLEALVPEIHIRDYEVVGLVIVSDAACRNEMNRTGRGSSPPRA
ncbi:MAG: recombinase family protein [Terriglobia bacterium]